MPGVEPAGASNPARIQRGIRGVFNVSLRKRIETDPEFKVCISLRLDRPIPIPQVFQYRGIDGRIDPSLLPRACIGIK